MVNIYKFFREKIAVRLILLIVLASTLMTLFFTALLLYKSQRDEKAKIELTMEKVKSVYADHITEHLWNLNKPLLQLDVESLSKLPNFTYASIKQKGTVFASAGTMPEDKVLVKTFPLVYRKDQESLVLGELVLASPLDETYSQLYSRAIFLLLFEGAEIFIISALLFLIFHFYVNRHLVKMAKFTRHLLSQGTAIQELKLDRPRAFERDELGELSESINQMQKQLKKSNQELEALNKVLQRKVEELENSNKELEQFAYIASHDLQAPLRHISSYIQLYALKFSDDLDENKKVYMERIQKSSDQMDRMIKDLLTFSRVGRGKCEFKEEDMNKLLEKALESLNVPIEENHASITTETLPTLKVSASHIIQLWQNLIENSLKFRKPEIPPQIIITTQEVAHAWRFSIQDNGIGLDAKYYDHIFQIFQRLHNKHDYPGTGIGLTICKKIVQIHGGQIWVESEKGKGSTFSFEISKELN